MKKILAVAGLAAAMAVGSTSAMAASPSDVAIGLVAGGLLGGLLASSHSAPAPAYAQPAPSVTYAQPPMTYTQPPVVYEQQPPVVYEQQAPIVYAPPPVAYEQAPYWVDAWGYRHYDDGDD